MSDDQLTPDRVLNALRKAHEAGNTEDARRLAKLYRSIESGQQMQPTEQPNSITPVQEPSALETFGKAFIEPYKEMYRGGKQLLGVGDQKQLQADIDSARQEKQGRSSTVAGTVGDIAGNISTFMLPGGIVAKGAAKALPAVFGGAPGLLRGAGIAAAQGATQGAIRDVSSDETRAGNAGFGAAGGVIGEGLGRVIKGTMAVGKGMYDVVSDKGHKKIVGNILNKATDNMGTSSINLQELVPGSKPTLAQSLLSPGLSSIERSINAKDSTFKNMLADRQADNNSARAAFISKIVPSEETLSKMKDRRHRDMVKNLEGTKGKVADLSPVITGIEEQLSGPAGVRENSKNALNFVKSKIENHLPKEIESTVQGPTFSFSKRVTEDTDSPVYGFNGVGVETPKLVSTDTRVSSSGRVGSPRVVQARKKSMLLGEDPLNFDMPVAKGHAIAQDINDLIAGKVDGNQGARFASKELLQAKALLNSELTKASPEYGRFLKNYSSQSKPIDAAERLGDLKRSVFGDAIDASGSNYITPGKLSSGLKKLDKEMREPGANPAKNIPQKRLDMLAKLNADLRRQEASQNLGRGAGSDTVEKLATSHLLEQGVPSFLTNGLLSGALKWSLGGFAKRQNEEVQGLLAEAVLNPKLGKQLMDAGLDPDYYKSALGKAVSKLAKKVPEDKKHLLKPVSDSKEFTKSIIKAISL